MRSLRKSIFGRACSILLCMLLVQQTFAFSLFTNSMVSPAMPDPVEMCLIGLIELVTATDADQKTGDNSDRPQNTGGTEEERCETETNEEKNLVTASPHETSLARGRHNTHLLPVIPAAFCTVFTPPPELG